jgi:hypothetical protein
MSFKAKFKAGAIEANVLSASFALHQDTDATGRPSSVTRGGLITITVESTDKTDLFEWMCNSFERKDGTITYLKRDQDAKSKELSFKEAYMVDYSEVFTSTGGDPFNITFTLSAKKIELGSGTHENEWV